MSDMDEFKARLYKPSEVVMMIAEGFGQILTPSVIRKYDYEVLADLVEPREPNAKRLYSKEEMVMFLTIAVLRSLGYSLKEIKRKLTAFRTGDIEALDCEGVMNRIERQQKSYEAVFNNFKGFHNGVIGIAEKEIAKKKTA